MSPVRIVKVLFIGVLCMSGVLLSNAMAESKSLTVAMLIPGSIDDGGFMEAGFNGLMAISESLGAQTSYMADVDPDIDTLAGALRRLAKNDPDLIIAHGGQTAFAARRVAAEYPQVRFVVIQGDITAQNLSSYAVLQEQSAWFASAAPGLLTDTGVVGHISGFRITPGLKRRDGATDAMREHSVKQFGNVGDWVTVDPEVFVGSSVADIGVAVLAAARDVANGNWEGNQIVQLGPDDVNATGLTLGVDVPDATRAQLEGLRDATVEGEIEVLISDK